MYDADSGDSMDKPVNLKNAEDHNIAWLQQTYGLVPPMDFLQDPNRPPLERTPHEDGFPQREVWAKSQVETNTTIIRQWQKKKAEQSVLGVGYESFLNYAVKSEVDKCQFREPADIVMKKLPPVERFAMERYIKELKDKELEAVDKARLYRNRCEDLVVACRKVEVKSLKRELAIRQYWRNSIHEGSTRGGLMVNLALRNKGKI